MGGKMGQGDRGGQWGTRASWVLGNRSPGLSPPRGEETDDLSPGLSPMRGGAFGWGWGASVGGAEASRPEGARVISKGDGWRVGCEPARTPAIRAGGGGLAQKRDVAQVGGLQLVELLL